MLNKSLLVAAGHFTISALIFKLLGNILPICVTKYYTCTAIVLLFAIISWYSFAIIKKLILNETIQPHNKAVLITGCNKGFGYYLAKQLDSKGWKVFASCRSLSGEGSQELRKSCSSNLQILELDVTKTESVQNAVTFVEQNLGSYELWALVNNAGTYKGLTIDMSSVQDFKDNMEVNVYGVVRVTQAFLPFIQKSKGRIVNITSVAGRTTIPMAAPYYVSKHASVGLNNCMRQELKDWGITVISIEPELFLTGLVCPESAEINFKTVLKEMDQEQQARYDVEYLKSLRKTYDTFLNFASTNIQAVIDNMELAISLKYPDSTYLTCRNAFYHLLIYAYIIAPISISDFIIRIIIFCFGYKKPKDISYTS